VKRCVRTLHQLGSIIYFYNIKMLQDLVILDPQWLMQVIATIFTTKHTWIKNGLLEHSALKQIWKAYPEEIHPKLLILLEKFQMVYTLQ